MDNNPMADAHHDVHNRETIAQIRAFNRFYTRQIGVLEEGLLKSAYSLTEVRVMYELFHRSGMTASQLAAVLGINHGYLSRLLARLRSLGVISRKRSNEDGRQQLLALTEKGRRTYIPLDARASAEVQKLLLSVPPAEVSHLLEAMRTIQRVLGPAEGQRSDDGPRGGTSGRLGPNLHED